jgi:paraquat-inducible protein B
VNDESSQFPEAVVASPAASRTRAPRAAWGVLVACAALAVFLVVWAFAGRGPEIVLRFSVGHGLKPGDFVKFRGIAVGEVKSVCLEDDLSAVVVRARLVADAAHLARAGSRFWIERPRIGLGRIRGLGTIVGGQHIDVQPGPVEGPACREFVGLEFPPELLSEGDGALEVILECADRSSLEPGSPVTYRGVEVGKVVSVGLANDAVKVEARILIATEYRPLVRDNSCFWRTGGLGMSFGLLTGFEMSMESLATIAAGGLALGTPSTPGQPVATGKRFVLHDRPQKDWAAWAPQIGLGSVLLPGGVPSPRMFRVSLSWSHRLLIARRERQRSGWALPIDGVGMLLPRDLVTPGSGAAAAPELSWDGVVRQFDEGSAQVFGNVALVAAPGTPARDAWPRTRARAARAPEDCELFGDPYRQPVAVSAARFEPASDGWRLAPVASVDSDWHGAAVVSRRDGALVGLLLVDDRQLCTVALLDADCVARLGGAPAASPNP